MHHTSSLAWLLSFIWRHLMDCNGSDLKSHFVLSYNATAEQAEKLKATFSRCVRSHRYIHDPSKCNHNFMCHLKFINLRALPTKQQKVAHKKCRSAQLQNARRHICGHRWKKKEPNISMACILASRTESHNGFSGIELRICVCWIIWPAIKHFYQRIWRILTFWIWQHKHDQFHDWIFRLQLKPFQLGLGSYSKWVGMIEWEKI